MKTEQFEADINEASITQSRCELRRFAKLGV